MIDSFSERVVTGENSMSSYHAHKWEPIRDLPADWHQTLVDPSMISYVKFWNDEAVKLREKDLYKRFLERLKREWSIETGAIEGLYTLSDGATMALIEQGLDAALIAHDDTNQSPFEVILKIRDQQQAIQGLYQFISGDRLLGTSYVKELHSVLTQHQPTYVGRDTLGNVVTRDLPRGVWKTTFNNVEHPDGSIFDYCPPEHVAQEMDNLISMHEEHLAKGVPPDVEAAWLHHRFTLIHPFTDGNGRVARCLATLVLLKSFWLPLVIRRDSSTRAERTEYIQSLRAADTGDLAPFVRLIGSLQRRAIRNALSLSEQVSSEATAVSGILESAKLKFVKRRQHQDDSIQEASETADIIHHVALKRLSETRDEIQGFFESENSSFKSFAREGKRDTPVANHFYYQIVTCAKELNYFANLKRYRSWVSLVIITEHRTELLFAFHGVGHSEADILGCSAMTFAKEIPLNSGGDELDSAPNEIVPVRPLSQEPFEFSRLEDRAEVSERFQKWVDRCILTGLDLWQQSL
jgi:Fic family protein